MAQDRAPHAMPWPAGPPLTWTATCSRTPSCSSARFATNAVLHGVGPIPLPAALDEERLRVEIVDQGSGFERQLRRDGVAQVGGWGLEFVEDLSVNWGVHEGSTHVWFELERRQARSVTAAHARRARDRGA